jgi:hypothetical protein
MMTWAGATPDTRYWDRIIRRMRQKNQYMETLDGPALFSGPSVCVLNVL